MRKIDLGQSIQILANIGVIAGIVFLGYELRQNNSLLEAQSRFNHKETRAGWLERLGSNQQIAEIISRAASGENLTDSDRFQLENIYLSLFASWEWEFSEADLGRIPLPATAWRQVMSEDPAVPVNFMPGIRSTWAENRDNYTSEFRDFMDSEVVGNERTR